MAVSPKEPTELSQIDLGDDLLAPDAGVQVPAVARREVEPTVHQDLDSARILMAEGLLFDARHTLFRVLRREPENPMARRLLEEIRTQEVQALIEARSPVRSTLTDLKIPPTIDPESALARLDADLRLGVDTSALERPRCEAWLEAGLPASASPRESMDWAVVMIVLGQPELAVEVLERAPARVTDPALQILHAEALVLCGRASEACMNCEQALRDPEISSSQRGEFNYLRARALELLGRHEEARSAYALLGELRDSSLRLRGAGG